MAQCQALCLYSGRFPLYFGRFPQIVQSGCISAAPSPIQRKISVSGHQKSRKGTNPIRLNDAILSFLPIRRGIFVYTALYSDAIFIYTCKKNHPSFVSKLGWLYGTSNGNRTHDFALRGQRLDRLTMEAYRPAPRIRASQASRIISKADYIRSSALRLT